GFHLHVENVELAVRPGHVKGMVVLASCFSSASRRDVEAAARIIRERCLADRDVRIRWCRTIDRAIGYLEGYVGELETLANGRKAELTFLKHALLAYETE